MNFKLNHIVYVCAWETPDGGRGFEWRHHAAEAQSVENYMMPDATLDGTRFARFAYPLPWGLSDNEITDSLEWEQGAGSFTCYLFPEDYDLPEDIFCIAGTGLTSVDFGIRSAMQ